MKKIDVRKIEPAGWVALAVAAVLVLAILGLAFRFAWPRLVGIERLPPMSEADPVLTPTSANRATSGPSKPTPTGWMVQRDVAGKEHLTPPPADEAAIREAFEAVMAVEYIESDDNQVALQTASENRQAVVEKANRLTDFTGWDWADWGLMTAVEIIPSEHWGTENPVRCDDYETCTAVWVKKGPTSGLIVYQEDICQSEVGSDAPCLVSNFAETRPYWIRVFTIKLQEDGIWRITSIQSEKLPPPP